MGTTVSVLAMLSVDSFTNDGNCDVSPESLHRSGMADVPCAVKKGYSYRFGVTVDVGIIRLSEHLCFPADRWLGRGVGVEGVGDADLKQREV